MTQGNPLLTLELGRALAGGRTWAIGAEPPVADLAGNPFGVRVAKLPGPRRALLATALSGRLSLPQLMAVADHAAVEELVAAGLLIPDGERVRLSHPLVAVAARRHSRIGERRALHLALADVAGDETLRARHLALSAPAQDADVAGIVAAAARPRRAGAPPMMRPNSPSMPFASRRRRRPSTPAGSWRWLSAW